MNKDEILDFLVDFDDNFARNKDVTCQLSYNAQH